LSRLALEPLACKVADSHALDMAAGNFLSHWGRDGLKPYQRYSFAGGCDAVAENNSAAHNLESTGIRYAQLTLAQMHRTMHDEVAPNDGHRRTMLGLHHTHAGFGMAMVERELRLVELYVGRYLSIAPYPIESRRKSTVRLEGRILDRKYGIHYAEVVYEPPPKAPDIAWLRQSRSYGLPAESVLVRPKLSGGVLYADGSPGELEVRADGDFRIPVRLPGNDAGIYTVVVWGLPVVAAKSRSRQRAQVSELSRSLESSSDLVDVFFGGSIPEPAGFQSFLCGYAFSDGR